MNFELKIDWATHASAKMACVNWHYSKCMPSGKLVKFGVWENKKFVGAVIFGLGATPNLCKPYGLKMTQVCELCRVALTSHQSPVTKILAVCLKLLKKKCPGLFLVVSFADSSQGHHGGIYQGGNWIFTGSARLPTWIIFNKKIHPRTVVAKYGGSCSKVLSVDPNAHKIYAVKHRYLFPLNTELNELMVKLKKPYPKRASSVESGTAGYQSAGGGESPTDALHFL